MEYWRNGVLEYWRNGVGCENAWDRYATSQQRLD